MLKSLTLVLAGLFAFSVNAAEPAAKPEMKWEAGKNYFVIDPPQPVATGDRIEVLEVFSYA